MQKVVYEQLQFYIVLNGIAVTFQSGFISRHSTEMALFSKVLNDLILMVDSACSAVLVLLDVTAAFDMLDKNILLSCLDQCLGVRAMALKWFQSYLSEGCVSVQLSQYSSATSPLTFGVPQESVLGPILFFLSICCLWGPFLGIAMFLFLVS